MTNLTGTMPNLPFISTDTNMELYTAKTRDIYQRCSDAREASHEAFSTLIQERAKQEKLKHDSSLCKPPEDIHVGTIVYWKCPNTIYVSNTGCVNRLKLAQKNRGPYMVLKVSPKGALTLKCLTTNKTLPRVIHRTHVHKPSFYNGFPNTPAENLHLVPESDQRLILDMARTVKQNNSTCTENTDTEFDENRVYEEELPDDIDENN